MRQRTLNEDAYERTGRTMTSDIFYCFES